MRFPWSSNIGLIAAFFFAADGNGFSSNSQWDDTFFSHVGVVNALVIDEQGYVYAGGEFGGIAEFNAFPGTRNLAQGDGQRWWQVGGGLNGRVNALALKGKDLYVGGGFSQAGTNTAQNLARWDGTNWSPIGTGVTGEVMALAFNGNDLYVGGRFTGAGNLLTHSVTKWDGTNWSDFGGVFLGPYPGTVRAILVHEGKVYIGGEFDRIGTNAAANVACWDGSSWQALGSGTNNVPLLRVQALGVDVAGGVYAGGLEDGRLSTGCPLFRWSGDRWLETPIRGRGDNTGVRAIATFGNDLYVGAGFFAQVGSRFYPMARFDGTNWTLPEVPFRVSVLAIASATNRMYVSGVSGIPLSRGGFGVMHYDGQEWSVIGKGVADRRQEPPNVINTLGSYRGFIVAGGRIRYGGFAQEECIAAWNGNIWSAFEPFQGGSLCSQVLTVDSTGGRLLAGRVDGLRSWNGTNWVAFGTGGPGTVHAIAVVGQEIYCGNPSGLWRWDGAWAPFAITGTVNALLYAEGVLYAGGAFTNAGGAAADNIARWDGFQWQGLSEGVNGPVHCLAKRGGILYAGGQFSRAGAGAAERVAAWNGTNWGPIGQGFSRGILRNGTVTEPVIRTLTFSDHGVLYAGGNFTRADGLAANHIAMWNGRNWLPLGGGVTNFVRALLWHENKLYVGGEFDYAGNTVSSRIALRHEAPSLNWSYLDESQQSVFSWPADFSNYVLEAANELPTSHWTPATNEVFTHGNQLVTTNSISGERQFFRLRRQ